MRSAAVGGLVVVLLCVLGCRRGTPHIHFVLPDGFRGEFRVYTNDPGGVELPYANGEYVVTIPPDGVLRIKGDGPFRDWHTKSASFASGRSIPPADELDGVPAGAVVLRRGGADAEGYYYASVEEVSGAR